MCLGGEDSGQEGKQGGGVNPGRQGWLPVTTPASAEGSEEPQIISLPEPVPLFSRSCAPLGLKPGMCEHKLTVHTVN